MLMRLMTKLPVFFVIALLVFLPVSVSAQISSTGGSQEYTPPKEASSEQTADEEFSTNAFCIWPKKECANQCWWGCESGSNWYCGSAGAVCCKSNAKFCDGSAGKCWSDDCPAGTKWTCKSTGAVCESACPASNPKYCGGQCWTDCEDTKYYDYSFVCSGGKGVCNLVGCRDSEFPNLCGNDCWSNCPSGQKWRCGSDGKGTCDVVCTDKDGDGYGSGCSKGSDCNDDDSSIWNKNSCGVCAKEPAGLGNSCSKGTGACKGTGKYVCNSAGTGTTCDAKEGSPSKEICSDSIDNDCDGTTDESSCSECPENEPKKCGSTCYSGDECEANKVAVCNKDNQVVCCSSDFPVYCGRTDNNGKDACWKSQFECDNSQKCGSEGWTICSETNFPNWNCRSDGVSRCCPAGYPYLWNSDWLCHTTTEPQKCSVPDGSSANCDCDTDAECQKASSSKPYCGQTYGKRTNNGYHACLTEKPQYCGDGTCNNEETYKTCSADCTTPKGKITANVYHTTTGKAISGAHIYLDGVPKGITNSEGKLNFEANYGNRNVKTECPDKKPCGERTVNVDGEEFASFECGCTIQKAELQIKVRTLHSATDEGYPIYNAYVFLNDEKKGLTDAFGNLYIPNVNYGNNQLGIGLKIADNENSEPYEHRYSYDLLVDEAFEERTINIELPSQQQNPSKNNADTSPNVFTASDYNATYSPEAIPLIVAAIVWIGFTTWAYGDYAKCVEETDSWWAGFGKLSWESLTCSPTGLAIGAAINKEHMGNCLKRAAAIARNTWEKCKLDAAFLGIMFIPPAWIASAAGKAFVVIKGFAYSIPYVEKFLGYGFKVIAQSETFIKISNGISEFGFKVVGGSLKIYDNVVGMIVKVMKNAGVSSKITATVEDLLRATKFSELPGVGVDIPNIKGALGESAAVKTADLVGEELAKEGAIFVRPSGRAKTVLKESAKYSLRFDNKGKIEIFDKINNNILGELDDFYLINGKPVVTEVKTMAAGSLDQQIAGKWNWFPPGWEDGLSQKASRNLNAIKDVTGETPEFIIMIPKGEASASKHLPNLLKDIRNAGFKAEYAELEATNIAFDNAARRIYGEAKQGGK